MVTTEKAIDILPHAAEIFEKLDIQKFLVDQYEKQRENKEATIQEKQQNIGYSMVLHVVKNSGAVKEDFFKILSILGDCSVKEAKKKPVTENIKLLSEVFTDPELLGFFKGAMQSEQEK